MLNALIPNEHLLVLQIATRSISSVDQCIRITRIAEASLLLLLTELILVRLRLRLLLNELLLNSLRHRLCVNLTDSLLLLLLVGLVLLHYLKLILRLTRMLLD